MKILLVFAAIALTTNAVHAAQTADLRADLSKSPGFANALNELLVKPDVNKMADRCESEIEIDYEGVKGKRVQSLAVSGKSFQKEPLIDIVIDPQSPNHDRKIRLTEACRYSYTEYYSCTDSDGKTSTCSRTETDRLYFVWECGASVPYTAGQGSIRCQPTSARADSHFRRRGLNAASIKKFFSDAKFELPIKIENVKRKSDDALSDVVGGGRKVWIRITEGVTGHSGEDDFEYTVKINGKEVGMATKTGQLNYDLEYQTSAQNVQVEIKAVEKDMLFDDHYTAKNSLTLTTKPPGNIGTIDMQRDTWLWSLIAPRDHRVTVIVTEDQDQLDLLSTATTAGQVNAGANPQVPGNGIKTDKAPAKAHPTSPWSGSFADDKLPTWDAK